MVCIPPRRCPHAATCCASACICSNCGCKPTIACRNRCLKLLAVRVLATIVTSASSSRPRLSHAALLAVLDHGMAEALLLVLLVPQLRFGSLITVPSTHIWVHTLMPEQRPSS